MYIFTMSGIFYLIQYFIIVNFIIGGVIGPIVNVADLVFTIINGHTDLSKFIHRNERKLLENISLIPSMFFIYLVTLIVRVSFNHISLKALFKE